MPEQGAGACVVVAALLAEGAKCEGRGQMDGRHDAAGGVITLKPSTHRLRLLLNRRAHTQRRTVGGCIDRGVHQMLHKRNSSGSPALLRSTRIKMRAVASIFHTA